jgi:DNA-binding response OmpR family regulator/glycine cleavage system H lipoate-binding protein
MLQKPIGEFLKPCKKRSTDMNTDMNTLPRVLVVDDEEVICSSCDRILRGDGFQVETSTDVLRGLDMAERNDYAVILLDIRMEEMDGLEFLKRLRVKKPDVPVIIITGYPSPESRSVSMQRGASDYIPKPFTPQEISESVRRAARWEQPVDEPLPAKVVEQPQSEEAPAEAVRPVAWRIMPGPPHFLDETWLRQCEDGQACLGAFLPRLHRTQIDSVRLPRAGDKVQRGLPLAALTIKGEGTWTVPSPVSGTVAEVHQALARHPEVLWREPFRSGWIARVRPDRLGEDLAFLGTRRLVLVASDRERAGEIATRLVNLGCEVHIHGTAIEARDLMGPGVLMVDASSCGEDGVRAVERVKAALPEMKVVILGEGDSPWEATYRASGVFYYAVEPFEDMEIADILFDAFRSPIPNIEEEPPTGFLPEFISRLRMTNRRGRKVSLLAEKRLLSRNRGLGHRLVAKILGSYCPLETTLTARPADLDEAEILREADECDVLLILRSGDTSRVPGSATIKPRKKGDPTGSTRITIHPKASESLPLTFDARTTEALANFILKKMM